MLHLYQAVVYLIVFAFVLLHTNRDAAFAPCTQNIKIKLHIYTHQTPHAYSHNITVLTCKLVHTITTILAYKLVQHYHSGIITVISIVQPRTNIHVMLILLPPTNKHTHPHITRVYQLLFTLQYSLLAKQLSFPHKIFIIYQY